jgi:hypothetical protein
MKPQAVFVETNWVVDIVAPAHLQSVQAAQLLSLAEAGFLVISTMLLESGCIEIFWWKM